MYSLIVAFCTLGIVFSVVASMVDISKFEKEFRLLFTSIVSIVLLQALTQLDFSTLEGISLEENPYGLQSLSTDDYTQTEVTAQVETSIGNFLAENGLECKNISVDVNITQDGCISISSVTLTADDFPEAKALLLQNFGESITVLER